MMRSVISGEELLHKTHAIGQYYGFTQFSAFALKASQAAGKKITTPTKTNALEEAKFENDPIADTIAQFLKHYRDAECTQVVRKPIFLWHTNIAPGRPTQKNIVVQFHALGTDRAIADTVVIRALLALTRDLFREEPTVHINSMGDKETRARYARELGTYFKKRSAILSEECLERARRDVLLAAEFAILSGATDDLPAPIEHLSDASRKRFEDLLEYLEMTETPYELERHLINRGGGAWNDLCFEIRAGGQRVAWGSHYGDLTRRFFPSSPFPATGAVLQIAGEGSIVPKVAPMRLRFSFVHIGDEAKRLSLHLADEFRKARVPLTQHVGIESLTEQLHIAEEQNNPYLIIMGRKEALEHSAIIRNRATQEETVIPLTGIIDRLKALA